MIDHPNVAGPNVIVTGLKSFTNDDITPEQLERYTITPTGETSINSGRARFRVLCKKCGKLLHPNTNGPQYYIQDHENPIFAEWRQGCNNIPGIWDEYQKREEKK